MIKKLKNNFFEKPNLYGLVYIKIELNNQDKWNSHNFY